MTNFKTLIPLLIILIFLFLAAAPVLALELELTYPSFGNINLNELAENEGGGMINDLIAWLYYAIITIAGLAAFFMIVTGGFQYLTSAGNPTSMGDAKDRIFNAVLGLILIFTSYLILQVINPDLLLLKLPTL